MTPRELEAEPQIFSDIVALLGELVSTDRSSDHSVERSVTHADPVAAVCLGGDLLLLCGMLAKVK